MSSQVYVTQVSNFDKGSVTIFWVTDRSCPDQADRAYRNGCGILPLTRASQVLNLEPPLSRVVAAFRIAWGELAV